MIMLMTMKRCRALTGRAALILAAPLGLVSAHQAAAQTIAEYGSPSGLQPYGIASSYSGAMTFFETGSTAKIGRIAPDGTITETALGAASLYPPGGFTIGPDSRVYFTDAAQNSIVQIAQDGTVTAFAIPNSNAQPAGIVTGADDNLWFTRAGSVSNVNVVGTFSTPASINGGRPTAIVAGPDGNLWFADSATHAIGRITTSSVVTEFPIGGSAGPVGIAAGSDGALWFTTGSGTNQIGRITTSGSISTFASPSGASLAAITNGPDGALWFVDTGNNAIGRVTTGGAVSETPVPTNAAFCTNCSPTSLANQIAAGPDGSLWFTETAAGKIGKLSPGTSGLVAAVLPASRAATVGNTVTAFATMINASGVAASGCAIVPVTTVPANFLYQTTNPATNALTGTANTPVNIPAGQGQSFVIAFTPTAPVFGRTVDLGFYCSGFAPAASILELDTLSYIASATPVPDVVALAATTSNDGTLHIPGASGSAAFAVATVNLGSGDTISATAGANAGVPITVTMCQTNSQTGQCLAAPTTSVSTMIAANATPTFAIFATPSGAVSFLPATNRIYVYFVGTGFGFAGSTSVAVTTQ